MDGRAEPKVKSLAKALNILSCFTIQEPVLGVTELANRIGVDNVSLKRGMLALRFSQKAQIDPMKLIKAMQKYPGKLSLAGSNPPVLMIADGNRAAGDLLRRAIPLLEDVVNQVTKTDE